MTREFSWFKTMNNEKRVWVRELVERFGWNVKPAIQQVHFFGIDKCWIYDYRTGELVAKA